MAGTVTVHFHSAGSALGAQDDARALLASLSLSGRQVDWKIRARSSYDSNADAKVVLEHPIPPDLTPAKLAVWTYTTRHFVPPSRGRSPPPLAELQTLPPFDHWRLSSSPSPGNPSLLPPVGEEYKYAAKKKAMGNPLKRKRQNKELSHPEISPKAPRRSPRSAPVPTRSKPTQSTTMATERLSVPSPSEGDIDLSFASIKRCVPYVSHVTQHAPKALTALARQPYRHVGDVESTYDPRPRHEARVHYSYLDSEPTSPGPTDNEPTSSASRSPAAKFPKAFSLLRPGRHGAWLIPLSGPFPMLPHASSPLWAFTTGRSSSHLYLTDARLCALWEFIDVMHRKGILGNVNGMCVAGRHPSLVPEGGGAHWWPDHVRVDADGHLALMVRAVLKLVRVATTDDGDSEEFLNRAKLVWVDEQNRPVLLA